MNHTESAAKPMPVWRRVVLALGIIVVALVVGGYISSRLDNSRVLRERDEIEAYLDRTDPNWRLADLENAREQIPDNENSAPVIVLARRLIPKEWPSRSFNDTFTYDIPSNQRFTDEQIAALRSELESVEAALTQARRLESMPRGRHRFEWAFNPITTIMNDQQESRRVAAMLQYDAWVLAYEGDLDGALRSCRACLNTGRAIGDEALLISQLIRVALVAVASNSIERTLFHGQASSAELVKCQELLALEDQHPSFRIALRGERASGYDLMTKMTDGRIPMRGMMSPPDMEDVTLWQRLFGIRIDPREPTLHLKRMTKAVEATTKPFKEQTAIEDELEAEAKKIGHEMVMTRLLIPAIGKCALAHRRKLSQVRCLMTLMAIERYRMKRGDWPASLEALAPDYLQVVPIDPFDGQPIRYKRLEHGVVVYSVGYDGVDDGGNINRAKPQDPGVDLGFWLWNLAVRPGEKLPQPQEEP